MFILTHASDTSYKGMRSLALIENTLSEAKVQMIKLFSDNIQFDQIPEVDRQKMLVEIGTHLEEENYEYESEDGEVSVSIGKMGYSISINGGEEEFRCSINKLKVGEHYTHDL